MFTWLRPNDLVWNYWVNNYLMGDEPPTFDILAWNNDATNLPAALHSQFLDIFTDNVLAAGEIEVLGTPIDLGRIALDTYVTGGLDRPPHALEGLLPHHAAASAATARSSSATPATSRASSIRPATRRPTTSPAPIRARTPTAGAPARRSAAGPGGRTGPAG